MAMLKATDRETMRYDRQTVYICAAVEIIMTLGASICAVPSTRLIEGAVCQRFYASNAMVAESRCKSDEIQASLASLLATLSSLGFLPGLVLIIPYGLVAEHLDRRILLVVNAISYTASMLYIVAICYIPAANLKLLWLVGLFDFIGGGGSFFSTLIRTIIAEAVPSDALSHVYYRLSGINLIIRVAGIAAGSWLLKNGAASAMLTGICIFSLVIPLLTFLPPVALRRRVTELTSIPLQSISSTPMACPPEGASKRLAQAKVSRSAADVRVEIFDSIRAMKVLFLNNYFFKMCLGIMFLNTTGMGVRLLIRPWMSKRYDLSLADTGYIHSAESLLSATVLFTLPLVDPRSTGKDQADKRVRELRMAKITMVAGILGSFIIAASPTQSVLYVGLAVFSLNVGFLDAIKAYFTGQFPTHDIGRLYIAITVVDILAAVLGAQLWGAIFVAAYSLGNVWLGLPFLCASVILATVLRSLNTLRK